MKVIEFKKKAKNKSFKKIDIVLVRTSEVIHVDFKKAKVEKREKRVLFGGFDMMGIN